MKESEAIPPGQRVFPYLIVKGAAEAIAFYERALNAEVTLRLEMPDGSIGHAELAIGGDADASFWLADESPERGYVGPATGGHTTVLLSVYVADVDGVYSAALEAGATSEVAPKVEFYGDRVAKIRDPFGHRWMLHQRLETLTPEEVKQRMMAASEE